jgi:glycosyltransferase involved in cell wall biosynthesis
MKKILLAQLKKPPFETRIFDKIGKSLSDKDNFRITILGNSIPSNSNYQIPLNVRLLPVFQSRAHSTQVLTDILRFQTILYSELPDVVIVCAPELLAQAVIYGVIRKKFVILDLQENFPFNYSYQAVYRWPLNKLLRLVSSSYFSLLLPFVQKVWLAERVYLEQLGLSDASVIENKVPSFWQTADSNPIQTRSDYLLFSGYITEESGVLKALDFFLSFQKAFPKLELFIVGYCPSESLRVTLKAFADSNHGIQLVGLDNWVMSATIFDFLKSARAVLMPYNETKANAGKIPTKLFEAASLHIPVILPLRSQFLANQAMLNFTTLEADFTRSEHNDFQKIYSNILSHSRESGAIEPRLIFESEKIISETQDLISES